MPTLEFEGKSLVYSHHLSVPYREMVSVPGNGIGEPDVSGCRSTWSMCCMTPTWLSGLIGANDARFQFFEWERAQVLLDRGFTLAAVAGDIDIVWRGMAQRLRAFMGREEDL